MELLCAKGGEQRETQANELLFMIIFLSHSDTRQSGNVLNVCYLFFRWSFFRSRLFFRKAKHASNRAGKMQQRSAAAAASFDSFFFGMPQFFLMFFFFAFTFLLYFSSLACSRLWISFSYNEMVFRKTPKPECRIFNLPKTSYLVFISIPLSHLKKK